MKTQLNTVNKTPMRSTPVCTAASAGAMALLVTCATLPVDTNGDFFIRFTLEDGTNTEATFSGRPVTAYLAFDDSVYFDDVAWHLGNGKYQYPDIDPARKIKSVGVELSWTSKPRLYDTASGRYYDSVYVSMGGEQLRSNTARVYVANVPPVIDSVKVSRTSYTTGDTISYSVQLYDTLATFAIRVFAHDNDANALSCTWRGADARLYPNVTNNLLATYVLPSGTGIVDTIGATVYDGYGGNGQRTIYIQKGAINHSPFFDSLRITDTTARGIWTLFSYHATALDTIRFHVFARDTDASDAAHCTVTGKFAALLTGVSDTAVRYLCKDSLYSDTLTFRVYDNHSVNVTKTVAISIDNRYPVIDSVSCGDSLFKSSAPLYQRSATALDSVLIRIYAHDPDAGDTLRDTALSACGVVSVKLYSNRQYRYPAMDSAYIDTVSLVVRDLRLKTAIKKIRFPVVKP
jgi:hypothetical protein